MAFNRTIPDLLAHSDLIFYWVCNDYSFELDDKAVREAIVKSPKSKIKYVEGKAPNKHSVFLISDNDGELYAMATTNKELNGLFL